MPDSPAESARSNSFMALIPGLLMTAYGWYAPYVPSGSGLHPATMHIFNYTLQFGGPILLIAALVCQLGQPAGIWIDAIASLVCGAILLLIGVYWIIVDRDLNDFLITIFALMLLGSGRRQLPGLMQARYRGMPDEPPSPEPRRPVEPPAPSIPEDPPPPDGYLAALGRAAKERHDARDRKDSAHGL